MIRRSLLSGMFACSIAMVVGFSLGSMQNVDAQEYPWRVGSATSEMIAEDSMVIGGGIGPGFTQGKRGNCRRRPR